MTHIQFHFKIVFLIVFWFKHLQKSNPLRKEEKTTLIHGSQTKRQGVFQEQLRAERESFKAVFDKRRQRIGGLDAEDE